MIKYFFTLILGILFPTFGLACLNGERMILENQKILYHDDETNVPNGHNFGDKARLNAFLTTLEKGYQNTKDLNYLSDKGYVLVVLGKYKEAIDLYKKIEVIAPGRYSTASNIGTAYELAGNNTEALKWIEKALKINPQSHHSSEWIHVNILKAKMKGDQYVSSKFLIGKDFGNRKYPESDLNKEELYILIKQIYYQLNERISFVKPKDKIVAQLLFDLGNASFLAGENEEAVEDYKLAEKYGFEDHILNERINLYSPNMDGYFRKIGNEITYQTREPQKFRLTETIVSVLAFLWVCLMVFGLRRKIFLLLK